MKLDVNINTGFGVNVRPIVMRGEEVVKEYPLQHNLVLDSGLEMLATKQTAEIFEYAQIGTGVTPTERTTADFPTTVTKIGTTISVDSGDAFFVAGDNNRAAKFETSGTVVKLTYVSASSATCDVSGAEVDQNLIVYNVEQTGLAIPNQISSTYRDTGNNENGTDQNDPLIERSGTVSNWVGTTLTTAGMNFTAADLGKNVRTNTSAWGGISTINGAESVEVDGAVFNTSGTCDLMQYGRIIQWRTFVYPDETGEVTYTEAGWSAESDCNPLFGRILFDIPVVVGVGDRLLLYVDVTRYLDTMVYDIGALPITNLTVPAKYRLTWQPSYSSSVVNSVGVSTLISGKSGWCVEPTVVNSIAWLAVDSGTKTIYDNTSVTVGSPSRAISCIDEVYSAGTYEKQNLSNFFVGSSTDIPAWTTIRIANLDTTNYGYGWQLKFDVTQDLPPDKTLTLDFKKSWTRYLGATS